MRAAATRKGPAPRARVLIHRLNHIGSEAPAFDYTGAPAIWTDCFAREFSASQAVSAAAGSIE